MNNFFDINPTWSPEQLSVLKSEPSLIINGCAGSGKTLLAIFLGKQISDDNKGTFLILVYTKALRSFIQQTLEVLGVKNGEVLYAHQLSRQAIKSYDYVIIDEAQDFTTKGIRYFCSLSRKGAYVFIDEDQRLYEDSGKKIGNDGQEVSEPTTTVDQLKIELGFQCIPLIRNFRISRPIVELILDVFPKCNLTFDATENLTKPQILKFYDIKYEIDWIVNYVTNHPNESIGILLAQNNDHKVADGIDRNKPDFGAYILPGILNMVSLFKEKGINAGYKHNFDDNLDFSHNCNVNITTYHSSKGLEFDTVIIPFLKGTTSSQNYIPLYVAMTRARSKLFLTFKGFPYLKIEPLVNKYK